MRNSTRLVVLGRKDEAQAYIKAVEAADGMALEEGVKLAINEFISGCKADGIWAAIKASCILAGARTLAGALVPLVGTAPTNFNFVAGDYNRKTGLVGDGSSKYLNSNCDNNSIPQNSHHLSIFASASPSAISTVVEIGSISNNETSTIGRNGTESTSLFVSRRLSSSIPRIAVNISTTTGFRGVARSNATTINARANNNNFTLIENSLAPSSSPTEVFRRGGDGVGASNGRYCFYSIGENLDLALLDARVTTLINTYNTAII